MEEACLGEWNGRGKTIRISKSADGEMLVDMGPGVPALTLVRQEETEEASASWPMTWAVVHRSVTTPGTVYIFELASRDASSLFVKKPSGEGIVEFERVSADVEPVTSDVGEEAAGPPSKAASSEEVQELQQEPATSPVAAGEEEKAASSPRKAAGSPPKAAGSPPKAAGSPPKAKEKKKKKRKHRSPSAQKASPQKDSPRKAPKQSFADSLIKIVSNKRVAMADREKMAAAWLETESKLLEEAEAIFKRRCVREAEFMKCSATISFEVLSRELEAFPKRQLSGTTYYVGDWGEGLSAESWFYAVRGASASFAAGTPVLFAEVLQSMLPKFVERLKELGFDSCSHEAGTWKIRVTWPKPQDPEE